MNFKTLHQNTIAVYQSEAEAWDQQRPKVFFEKYWLDRLLKLLPAKGSVLDIGCGAGDPISQYIIEKGFHLTGIDSASAMIDISSIRYPEAEWHVMDMRNLTLPESFDGIISWDGFFHLNQLEQRQTLKDFCQSLKPGGAMLLTIGDEAGEVVGMVNGKQVYHASLAPDEYRSILTGLGFSQVEIVLLDKDCCEHSVLLASGFNI